MGVFSYIRSVLQQMFTHFVTFLVYYTACLVRSWPGIDLTWNRYDLEPIWPGTDLIFPSYKFCFDSSYVLRFNPFELCWNLCGCRLQLSLARLEFCHCCCECRTRHWTTWGRWSRTSTTSRIADWRVQCRSWWPIAANTVAMPTLSGREWERGEQNSTNTCENRVSTS